MLTYDPGSNLSKHKQESVGQCVKMIEPSKCLVLIASALSVAKGEDPRIANCIFGGGSCFYSEDGEGVSLFIVSVFGVL